MMNPSTFATAYARLLRRAPGLQRREVRRYGMYYQCLWCGEYDRARVRVDPEAFKREAERVNRHPWKCGDAARELSR